METKSENINENEMKTKSKHRYFKNKEQKIKNYKDILEIKEFNIYEFVSVFNPLVNTLLTAILVFTDNLKIIAILVTSFNILIALYLAVNKYYLSNELPIEKRILIRNFNDILYNLRRLDEMNQKKCEYNLDNFQTDLFQNYFDSVAEMEKYINAKKYNKYIEQLNKKMENERKKDMVEQNKNMEETNTNILVTTI